VRSGNSDLAQYLPLKIGEGDAIGEATVPAVHNILAKLDGTTRAAAAAWAVRQSGCLVREEKSTVWPTYCSFQGYSF